jgi:hypothetical protein
VGGRKDWLLGGFFWMRNILLQNANENGIPILSHEMFVKLTEEYGKEKFRLDLAEYIATERPEFPFKVIPEQKVHSDFLKLKKKRHTDCIDPVVNVQKEIFEKYTDYKYPFVKHGLGIINGPSVHNDVSNYFHQKIRLACNSYGFKSPVHIWNNGTAKEIWRCLGPIWRGINETQVLTEKTYISAFRLQTYIATQFKPLVAKCIYEMTNSKSVLDTSMGWGDRLAGFYASDAEVYVGCDPNPNTFANYKLQCVQYEMMLGNTHPKIKTDTDKMFKLSGRKDVTIYRQGAETIPWEDSRAPSSQVPKFNCAFTSPPYFSTERYNEGGEHEDDQSWKKFDSYEKWRDNFFLPVAKHSFDSLDPDNGHLMVNIMDPTIKHERFRSCDELVDSLKDNFKGQIGMRIMQRPQGRKVHKTKEALDAFMNMIYIENIWYFTTSNTTVDVFADKRITTLEDFF